MPPEMTPPRDVQDYEAQARAITQACYNSHMREIPLSRGMVAIVDDDDYERLSPMKWHASRGRREASWYARHHGADGRIAMARYIVGAKPGEQVDHINGNTLDNRKANLRLCSNAQNAMNTKANKPNSSGFKGVGPTRRSRRPWGAKISLNGKTRVLGYYATAEEAARAYDAAALDIFGEFARTNFPVPGREDRMRTPQEYAVTVKLGADPVSVLRIAMVAAERSALERAAQVADEEHAESWKSSRAADARGDHRVGAADAISAATAQRIAFVIRALIAPAPESPPAPDYDPITAPIPEGDMNGPHGPLPDPFAGHSDAQLEPPYWRIGSHYGIHVYRGDTPIATFHTVENAQAAVRAYNASLDAPARYVVPVARLADAEKRIAELEAALAKAHDAIRWACGDEPLKDGRWFNCRAFGYEDNAAPRYWWRSILRLYSGLPDAPAPSKEPPP